MSASSDPNARPPVTCPRCKTPLPAASAGECACPQCGLGIRISDASLACDFLALLRAAFPRRYRLYKALCNNGAISYQELAAGSLSLPERKDVAEFGAFLGRHAGGADRVLDIGCGPLPVPGYLQELHAAGARLLGLDVYPTEFRGFRITGCAEFLPLPDGGVDVVVFATSLDHVCDLDATLREVRRVLPAGGRCCVWMSDRKPYWKQFLFHDRSERSFLRRLCIDLPKQVAANLRDGRRLGYGIFHYFTRGRYWDYDNGSVFYCPPGAVDPFHSFFESPAEVTSLAARHGLDLTERKNGSNGVFLAFTRRSS
jgi:SAM-dependent methyltransferase